MEVFCNPTKENFSSQLSKFQKFPQSFQHHPQEEKLEKTVILNLYRYNISLLQVLFLKDMKLLKCTAGDPHNREGACASEVTKAYASLAPQKIVILCELEDKPSGQIVLGHVGNVQGLTLYSSHRMFKEIASTCSVRENS